MDWGTGVLDAMIPGWMMHMEIFRSLEELGCMTRVVCV